MAQTVDESIQKVVRVLMAETNFLRQIIASKTSCCESLKNQMVQMQNMEKMLRLKLSEETEQIRTENERLHKALSLLSEQAFMLCEENRRNAITIEKQKEKEAEMLLKQVELESELKMYREGISDSKSKIRCGSLDLVKKVKDS